MKGKKLLFAGALLAICGTALASSVTKSVDSFDGAMRVDVDRYYGLDCGAATACASLGADWLSTRPGVVVLRLNVLDALTGIDGLKFNVDGEIVDLNPAEKPTDFENGKFLKTSKRDFFISVAELRKVLAAKSVKVRILTQDGLVDATLSSGTKASSAYGALKEFVEAIPAQDKAQ